MIDPQTIGKMADASGEIAKTANTGLELAGRFSGYFDEALTAAGTMLGNEIKYRSAKRAVRLGLKWNAFMDACGLPAPSRRIPLRFSVPLLIAAILEEDDDLQDAWARLLVNAGNATTEMELRTAYVEILRGMSGFDVRNLSKMAEAALSAIPGQLGYVDTKNLPHSATWNHDGPEHKISTEVAISLANLSRLGCVAPVSGYGGGINFSPVLVTELGLALYRACS
jgi:hypothetical protein